ncbi:putative membrane protein (TIGR02226 family) [Lutibacter oceani]|uniref:Putative membrane protein (TIGR02226 family) n=1 Tax=Lutibacter oceani TaxID=1853311 RepID=A0A3D9RQ82_9FLAO|nr:BatA domain-containing protein [Lutibacter oceani]REE82070.1 putative membrane protein (TIGR02226 family) [Lutibacter oceani]
MQFKHPEILYALLLLIIPIIVHLFQLQRFIKVPFTNVKFLKNIEQQTRKSARLKKWLVLASRLLAFTTLIIAFAQPYFSKFNTTLNYNTTFYLDNSFSMQAKGANGELLKNAAQNIIENNTFKNSTFSILTNNDFFPKLDAKNLKSTLINLKYYPIKVDFNTVLLKLNSINNNKINTLYKNILISDFQNINFKNKSDFTNVNSPIQLLKVIPKTQNNIYIDSVFINNNTSSDISITALVKSTKKITENVPVSLFSNSILIGKATSKFDNSKYTSVQFTIPNATDFNGKISLNDAVLEFDNDFFFTLSKPEKINVLSIENSAGFLPKIYTENEFNFTSFSLQNLNYNTIQNQQLIVLNEIEKFPIELIIALKEYFINGGNLVLIPSEKTDILTYNNLLNQLGIGLIKSKENKDHKITSINYNHPLVNDVFEKRVQNFQYPKTNQYFKSNFKNAASIINFDNNDAFISSANFKNNNFYWVASPLNYEVSDFTQSPLIVPVFYNFAKNSSKFSELYYTISQNTNIDVKIAIGKEQVLKISDELNEFIPLQQIGPNKVTLKIEDNILKSGFYNITNGNEIIKKVAFNYNRNESDLTYTNIKELSKNNKDIIVSSSIDEIFKEINNQQKNNWLFKWFLAFSVLFLLIEMLLLKYFKI